MAFKKVRDVGDGNGDAGGEPSGFAGIPTVDPGAIGDYGNDSGGSDSGDNRDGGSGPELTAGQKRWETRRRNAAERGEPIPGTGKGSRGGNKQGSSSTKVLTPDRLAPPIMVAHMMLAAKLGPEFAMTESEAVQLSTAICNYLQHTKIKVNPKTEALMAMLGTVSMIEGTRIMAFTQRKATENASKKRFDPNKTVVPLHPGGAEHQWNPPYAN